MIKQLTVIADSRTGLIADISRALAEGDINIRTIEAVEVAEQACVRLQVDDLDGALSRLNREGMTVVAEDVLLLRIPDQPGSLANASNRLAEAGIDIRAITMVHHGERENIVALACADPERARQLLDEWMMN
ncbi:hypothetical protein [Natronospira bacteriovora]|uniref:ACT domain-containing protein n=1 Tax=Natronospira bacteriovora TaxID=3069753 RepID=A0ABU0W820_9GAMM|nr:hypothetical protein [Natronospira sp. AB-CW4]MDQ2070064.1 hypothetical protein [Natronospira sp. AB-CW4]